MAPCGNFVIGIQANINALNRRSMAVTVSDIVLACPLQLYRTTDFLRQESSLGGKVCFGLAAKTAA